MKASNAAAASLMVLALLAATSPARAQDYYQWTDPDGTVHVSTEPPPESAGKAPAPRRGIDNAGGREATATKRPPPSASVASLKRFEVPYLANEGRAHRVIVQVKLNDRVTAPMALDTGAPGMVVSAALAEKLGVFSSQQGTLLISSRGIGGSAPAILSIVESVSIGEARERFVPVTITDQLSEAFEGLIGMDFMSQYSMTIDSSRRVVVFQEQPSSAEAPGGHNEAWWRNSFEEFRGQRDAWLLYRDDIEREIRDSQISAGAALDALLRRKALANFQYQEAEKLFSRLERHASAQSVPRHWR